MQSVAALARRWTAGGSQFSSENGACIAWDAWVQEELLSLLPISYGLAQPADEVVDVRIFGPVVRLLHLAQHAGGAETAA